MKGRLGESLSGQTAGNSKKTKVNEPMVKNPKRPLTVRFAFPVVVVVTVLVTSTRHAKWTEHDHDLLFVGS